MFLQNFAEFLHVALEKILACVVAAFTKENCIADICLERSNKWRQIARELCKFLFRLRTARSCTHNKWCFFFSQLCNYTKLFASLFFCLHYTDYTHICCCSILLANILWRPTRLLILAICWKLCCYAAIFRFNFEVAMP